MRFGHPGSHCILSYLSKPLDMYVSSTMRHIAILFLESNRTPLLLGSWRPNPLGDDAIEYDTTLSSHPSPHVWRRLWIHSARTDSVTAPQSTTENNHCSGSWLTIVMWTRVDRCHHRTWVLSQEISLRYSVTTRRSAAEQIIQDRACEL